MSPILPLASTQIALLKGKTRDLFGYVQFSAIQQMYVSIESIEIWNNLCSEYRADFSFLLHLLILTLLLLFPLSSDGSSSSFRERLLGDLFVRIFQEDLLC